MKVTTAVVEGPLEYWYLQFTPAVGIDMLQSIIVYSGHLLNVLQSATQCQGLNFGIRWEFIKFLA